MLYILKKNKIKVIIFSLVLILLSLTVYFTFNKSNISETDLNNEELQATKLIQDWIVFLNYYDNNSVDSLYDVKIKELYYYKSDTEFIINMSYYLDNTDDDNLLMIAIKADNDNFELVDSDTIKDLLNNFIQGFGRMLSLRNDLLKNYSDNSIDEGSVYIKIEDQELAVINKLLANGLSKDEINEKYERFKDIRENMKQES